MIKARLDCKVIIRNVPESIINGSRAGFVCARVYGCYETYERASEVALELGNGIVVEVPNESIYSES